MTWGFRWRLTAADPPVLVLDGELDALSVKRHRAQLLDAVGARAVLVDAGCLEFTDSVGLSLLTTLADLAGGQLLLLRPKANLRSLIDISGLGELLLVGD